VRPAATIDAQERVVKVMQTQEGISAIEAEDFPRVVEVWEASVRATHHFLTQADIQFIKSLVEDDLKQVEILACVRDDEGQVAGFVGVEGAEVAALFIHPQWRGQGIGRRLLSYAVETLGATELDVNEQNDQAVGFYHHMGFEVVGRSAEDGLGQPFPLLHMRVRPRGTAQSAPC
jgi:putative acetyltransferase